MRLNLEHAAVRCWIIQGIVPQQKSTNTGHPIAVYTFEGSCKEIIIVKSAEELISTAIFAPDTYVCRFLQCTGGKERCESLRSIQLVCHPAYSTATPV